MDCPIGWLFSIFNWFDPIIGWGWLILHGLWFGTLVGALFGLLAQALTGGRRDFASIGAMRANSYELLVDDEVAAEAERLINQMDQTGRAADAPTRTPSPPETPPTAPAGT